MLISVGVMASLVALYAKNQTGDEAGEGFAPTNVLARSHEVACLAQRRQVERDVMMFVASHPDKMPTIVNLEDAGIRVPWCPDGGDYRVERQSVLCSEHD
jgi:hypothetical protein